VLIVEDDLTSATALRSILTRKGCQVELALTLAEGMRLLSGPFDFVILDLMLPDGNGADLLRRVRQQVPGLKVAVMTALADTTKLREVQAMGPHRLLRKPIDLVDLLGAMGMM
jgi:DNA-binding response OmpR family regulator